MEFAVPEQLPPVAWVTSAAVMEHLQIRSKVTLTKMIRDGLPAHKVGKGYRFDLLEVDDWVKSRCIAPRPDDEGAA